MTRLVVQAVDLAKRYRAGSAIVRAIAGVSLSIARGELIAIVGRSGSGKSTLLSLLGMLERPDGGHYLFNGSKADSLSEDARAGVRSRQIGFVFQFPALLARHSALENVELPLGYCDVPPRQARQRALAALDRVGLSHRADHWPNQLSGGEQQRASIARAIVNDPDLILADEPTGALDSKTSDEILDLFKDLHRAGRTIAIVTHSMDVAQSAQRRITLHDGQIVADEAAGNGSGLAIRTGVPA
jgi:ABC-type lipoprotein export system ATPase subunit